MNNLKYYEDSLAYDFSMFAPAEKITPNKKGKITIIRSKFICCACKRIVRGTALP